MPGIVVTGAAGFIGSHTCVSTESCHPEAPTFAPSSRWAPIASRNDAAASPRWADDLRAVEVGKYQVFAGFVGAGEKRKGFTATVPLSKELAELVQTEAAVLPS